MALIDGGSVGFVGSSTIVVAAGVNFSVTASLVADTTTTALARAVVQASASLVGDCTITPTVGTVLRQASTDLVGDCSVVAFGQYLFKASLAGDSTVSAEVQLQCAAVSSVQGDATFTATPHAQYGAEAALVGDADLTGTVQMKLGASTNLVGDASLTATALADDEMAADLVGATVISATPTTVYAAEAAIEATSFITAVAMMIEPFTRLTTAAQEIPNPFKGLQVGRVPLEREERSTLVTGTRNLVDVDDSALRRR